jgi:ribose-phosphate pyrophosphokinase
MTLLFSYPGNEHLATLLTARLGRVPGKAEFHRFPDGETLVRIDTPVEDEEVVLLCSLDRPDEKAMPLMFFADTARELGANSVRLIAPYLGYMRQDKRFHEGEALTSARFARFLSEHFDGLVTVDPHLHRHKNMNEIYSIPCTVVQAAPAIADWIKANVPSPLLIGPDSESDQWVGDVARQIGVPYAVLSKIRRGDRHVEVSVPDLTEYRDRTPVLVDDIISSAHTMIEAVKSLKQAGMKLPLCMGVHALFASGAFEALSGAGLERIITSNTVSHPTNGVDVSGLIAAFV